ncbi:hypothetical protein SCRM01_012 [Synechococcus phage S-CRM01]|uniref:hypothetical protein n=1 Tax=Synechococcus phage S-CRM01 TaxID=1026955 RepID=UPI000209E336|nr:hypothetical protein SCRM01_012 [Synechococcus phage S-CRM01]AEC52960.1 hypothetical protein SCRM01_012 [Synechococcus phage S-CRM01]
MAVNFPNNPTPGLSWLDPSNNVSYVFDGVKWTSTGTGISFDVTIFTLENDDPELVGGTTTDAINAALIAAGRISSPSILRPGNTTLISDSGNPDENSNVTVGQYIYDGFVWVTVPTTAVQVLSVFGRIGVVTAQEGDYNLGQLGDVNTTVVTPTATTNSLLRFNGTTWVPGEARNTPSVTLPLTKTGNDVTPALGFNIDGLTTLP